MDIIDIIDIGIKYRQRRYNIKYIIYRYNRYNRYRYEI